MPADIAPPGRESQVQALKKEPGVSNPFAVAWASYNKSSDAVEVDGVGLDADARGIVNDSGSWLVVDTGSGDVVGVHEREEDAKEQARDPEGKFASGGGGGSAKSKGSGGSEGKKKAALSLGKQFAKNLFSVQGGVLKGAGPRLSVPGAVIGGAIAAVKAVPETIRTAKKAYHQVKGDSARFQRYDRGALAPAQRLQNGWLRVEGRSARTGILEYENPDGTVRRELVLPEELFSEESLDSARMVPVTSPHPTMLLDSSTAKIHQVGSVGENLRADGEYLVAPLMITDGTTVQAIESGRQELSWGYDCEVSPPDPALVSEWGAHDGIQRNRRYNHLACVDSARAGDNARIRLDSAGNQPGFASPNETTYAAMQQPNVATQQGRNPMPILIRLDGHNYNADDPALQQAIDRVIAQVRADGDKATRAEKERADALVTANANLKANAIQRGKIVRDLIAKADAMKARMVGCDECGGAKQIDGAKCDYCDGSGSFRMHDAVKAMPIEGGEVAEDATPPEMVDDADMEREPPAEEATEKAANAQHSDGVKNARQRRADSLARMIERAAKSRTALVVEASKHLGADAKFDGKTELAIKRDVVAKLAPHVKLDGLGDKEIALLYTTETARTASARKDGLTASDAVRAGLLPVPANGTSHRDPKWQEKVDAANRAKYHAWEPKAESK